ncbi:MAG: efflux RND transporter permease subunit [Gemmatimonadota bacterium]
MKFNLRTVPGVTEVLSFGGHVRQYHVGIDPNKLLEFDVTLGQVIQAIEDNNQNAGGSFIERNDEEYLVRGLGWVENLRDIRNMVVETHGGTPIRVGDLAGVEFGPEIRRGVVTRDGKGEVVSGIVLKLIGENTAEVIEAVKEKVRAINEILPEGVQVRPYYDQADLVEKAVDTVKDALQEGGILIVVVLLLFLGNVRSALVVTVLLPLSLFVAFSLMRVLGMSANLMSLGGLAIGLGMMVDGGVVMVENIFRHLGEVGETDEPKIRIVRRAAQEVGRPVVFAVAIIIVVFLPLFTLQGVEGKMFSPMAFAISFAMLGSLVFSLTVIPMLCSFLLKKTGVEKNRLVAFLKRRYRPILEKTVRHRWRTIGVAVLALIVSLFLVPFLGTEFIPVLDEGSILVRVTMAPSTALESAVELTGQMERAILDLPEINTVVSKIGRAEVGGDPEPVNNTEIYIDLKPEGEWTTGRNKEALIRELDRRLSRFPGVLLNFSQPIQLRTDELLSGVKAQLAIRLFGEDLHRLVELGDQIAAIVREVPGAADVQAEQVAGQPQLQIQVDRHAIARYGVNVEDVQQIVRIAIGGESAGQVFEGQRRYDIFVRFRKESRNDLQAISNILVQAPGGERVPLSRLTDISLVTGPKQISRDDNQRRLVIQANVRGRDMGGFVADAQQRIKEQVELPPGYFLTWGGQFENQQRAMRRLSIIVPVTVLLIFLLLFSSFNSLRNALLIVLNVPFAMIGGIVALWISGQYLSVPASVGFIALFGVAVLNGVVLVSYINQLRQEGLPLREAILQGSELRLRPVLMTALVASLGLTPLLFASGTGSEVQRPLAAVVVGGLVTSTLLTLVVLPTLYGWFEREKVEF